MLLTELPPLLASLLLSCSGLGGSVFAARSALAFVFVPFGEKGYVTVPPGALMQRILDMSLDPWVSAESTRISQAVVLIAAIFRLNATSFLYLLELVKVAVMPALKRGRICAPPLVGAQQSRLGG